MKRTLLIALVTSTMLSTAAFAQEATAPLPTWTGGIGQVERDLIQEKQNDYTLKIIFTGDAGMYVAGVRVVIKDKDGAEVVNTITQGPVLLADLPAGRYSVETNAEGNEKNFKVNLHSKLTTQHVRYATIKDTSGV